MRKEVPFRDELFHWSSATFEDDIMNAWILNVRRPTCLAIARATFTESVALKGRGIRVVIAMPDFGL